MKNNLPLVSVIIPCYNHEAYIQDSIQSILDQSYLNIELIVIDDGSNDRSFEKMQQMLTQCESRFGRVYFNTRENKGLCNTLNEALSLCKGEYVSIIASDDLMVKNKIEIQVEYALKYPEVTSFYGGVVLIDDKGNEKKMVKPPYKFYNFEDIFMHDFILYAPTQFHKLKDIIEVGGFDHSVKIEDWDLLLRLSKNNKSILCVPEILACYRLHEFNTSNKLDFMKVELFKILNKYKSEKLLKKAKYRIVKQYLLKPIKKVSKFKYYWVKIIYIIKNLFN